ncbi:MAG: SNF2-related protein, partial [Haloferula sp.]
MSDWNEQRVREEVSWQAFKEGKSLRERGRVDGLKVNGELATASFQAGKRRLRTVVRLGTQLEVECQCAENRRSGEICAHGVAVALACLSGAAQGAPKKDQTASPVEKVELRAVRVVMPPGFDKGLAAGRLGVRIKATDDAPAETDRALSQWLMNRSVKDEPTSLLSLQGADVGSFLDAIRGHSRVSLADETPLEVVDSAMEPIAVTDSVLQGDRVRISVVTEVTPIRWGEQLGWIDGNRIGKAPVDLPDVVWRDEAEELISSGTNELSLAAFLGNLDAWMNLLQPPYAGWLSELRFETHPADIRLEIEGSLNALDLKAVSGESERVELADDRVTIHSPDTAAHARIVHRLTECGFKFSGGLLTLRDHDQIVSFLANEIPLLEQEASVVLGSRLQHVRKSLHVVRPQFDFGSGGSLSCEISFQTDGSKVIPRAKVLELLRSGKSSHKTRSGAEVVIGREVSEELEPLLADLGIVRPEGKLQLNRAQHESLRQAADPEYRVNPPSKVPTRLGATSLRDYQIIGGNWVADRLHRFGGALLADEMGLGKTIQTIAAIRARRADGVRGPVLVLVPTSLLSNWQAEMEQFAPEWSVVRLHGPKRDTLRPAALEADVVLTSYGTMTRDLAFHLKQTYPILVCDEASLLRNPDSEVSRSVAKLNAEARLALTGTPVENRLRDLWSVFRVVSPGYLGSKESFLERYEADGGGNAQSLKARISPYLLRRTKTEVASDLPSRIEIDQWLELGSEARGLYRELAQAGLSQWEEMESAGEKGAASMHLLTTLLRLRQICLDPGLLAADENAQASSKVEWLNEFLEERKREERKTLVFSQFSGFLRSYEAQLAGRGIRVFRLDGQTRDRGRLVSEFQNCPDGAVFLI